MEEEKRSSENIFYLIPVAILLAGFLIAGAVYMKGKGGDGAAKSERADAVGSGTTQPENPQVAGTQVVDVSVDDDPTWGEADAKVTIIEFSEYECPFCQRYVQETYSKIKQAYPDQIRYVFRDFPLPFHKSALPAAIAANCAGAQDKYFEMHDLLFANRDVWSVATDVAAEFNGYAEELNLDMTKFASCTADADGSAKAEVDKDTSDGAAAGVNGTPAFFINGRPLVGALPFAEFKKVIDEELAK